MSMTRRVEALSQSDVGRQNLVARAKAHLRQLASADLAQRPTFHREDGPERPLMLKKHDDLSPAPYFPNGKSPMKVSTVALPVMRSSVVTVVTSWMRLMVMLFSFETALVNDPIFSPSLLMMSIV